MKTTTKTKTMLLASAAGAALMPNAGAQAADMPVKAAPQTAAANWAGWYIGANLGAAWQSSKVVSAYANGISFSPGSYSSSPTNTGFIGGGQIGYNWQRGNLVYGLEADISGLSKGSQSVFLRGKDSTTLKTKINWLATFRGRLGVTLASNTMAYATGGLAVGGVDNSQLDSSSPTNQNVAQDKSTRTGWVVGGGVEHMLARNWTVRLEGLYVDLGSKTATMVGLNPGNGSTTSFSNKATIARAAINFKF